MSSSHPSSSFHNLADTFLRELGNELDLCSQKYLDLLIETETGHPVSREAEYLSANSKTNDPFIEAADPVSRGAKSAYPRTRYYLVLTGGDKAALCPEFVQVMDVTEAIPKGCTLKARAFCSGVAFNFNFSADNPFMNYHQLMKVKLCVIGNQEDPKVIEQDRDPDPETIHGLVSSPAMKAVVSSVKDINLAEFIHQVGEYVGTKFGGEKKAEHLKMVERLTPSRLGSFDSMEIWQMLSLVDPGRDDVMESVECAQFVRMPITIDIPPAFSAHPTPSDLGWKAGSSGCQGPKSRPCIPDLNQVLEDLRV